MNDYFAQPWYVKPTIWNRWGPGAFVSRVLGMSVPGDGEDKYLPDGYAFHEMGPKASRGKGVAEMGETRERLLRQNRGGCPFGFVRSE